MVWCLVVWSVSDLAAQPDNQTPDKQTPYGTTLIAFVSLGLIAPDFRNRNQGTLG